MSLMSIANETDDPNGLEYQRSDIEPEELETDDFADSLPAKEPFDTSKIQISHKTLALSNLIARMRNREIKLDTEFQRLGNLWNRVQQSRLIESLLLRFPIPAFFFDGTNDDEWLVVDGLQRLSALQNYVIDGKHKGEDFGLKGLEFLSDYEGKLFVDLPRNLQRRIEESQVTVYVIDPGTPGEVKFNLFKRINTGGLVLTSQEIRHALYQPQPAGFIKELAQLPEFVTATEGKIRPDRMEDRDFVTRFLAFTLQEPGDYHPDMDSFINSAMDILRDKSEGEQLQEFDRLRERFKGAMIAAERIFGKDAFRKRKDRRDARKPINKALFEVWSASLARLSPEQQLLLIDRRDALIERFIEVMNDERFNRSVTAGTGEISNVNNRHQVINSIIRGTLV